MHILIAPNAFKNALSASGVAGCIQEGLRLSRLQCTSTCFPVGDGGDGTGSLLTESAGGSMINALVSDPLGRKISAGFGLAGTGPQTRPVATATAANAIIEMAGASGLQLLRAEELNPLNATSRGTGELIKAAFDHNAGRILLCIGGSATIDGGTGLLQALGLRFLDGKGNELQHLPESLTELASVDFSQLDDRASQAEIIVLCDVENTLLGREGTAAVFGPQKGASESEIQKLEAGLTRLRDVALHQLGKDMATVPYGGAAGGVAAGLAVFLNARLVNGTDFFLDYTHFQKALQHADLVITGEGSIDLQTLGGKAPFGVARRAKEKGIPVIGLAGKVPLTPEDRLLEYFDILLAIGNQPVDMTTALSDTAGNLIRTARSVGDTLALRRV